MAQLSDHEGFCYSLVEALELGTPVLVTDLEVLPELNFKEGENGYKIPWKINDKFYSSESFDIEAWMQKYGISYAAYSYGSGTKYCLTHCPFDHNHTGKDAAIFKRSNGAIAFKCLHNSCADKTWKDVRMLFEPDAYERKRQQEERQIFNSYNRDAKPEPVHIEQKEGEPIFFTAKQILARPKQTEQIIKTGIYEFDKKYRGLRKKDVTALSGQAGSAKSTILSQIILNAIDAGNNVAVFSGELAEDDYMRWMYQQGAGRRNSWKESRVR